MINNHIMITHMGLQYPVGLIVLRIIIIGYGIISTVSRLMNGFRGNGVI